MAAEIEANLTRSRTSRSAPRRGHRRGPCDGFFGGLGDLLVTTAMGDWTAADEAHIAYGLSSWHPTAGTRVAGAVSGQRRVAAVSATPADGWSTTTTLCRPWSGPSRLRSAPRASSESSPWPTSSPFPATWPSRRCAPT
ncbi:hypothetical protein NKG94_22630 [Micromonospora sp. M12]